jgi:diaminopimelate epimerase
MKLSFYKYQGTGNDFVILDNRDKKYSTLSISQVAFLCDRKFGIGADGLMLLNLIDDYDFEMEYYNSDGNVASMCGNGARCLVQFANDIGIKKQSYHFIATDGPHEANFAENAWVQLKMKDVNSIKNHRSDFEIDTGSPHYIKFVENVKDYDVVEEGKRIRYSSEFNKKGINVNFVQPEHNKIIVRTYERGVENETLSCGTGVTACALINAHNDLGFNRINIETPGGNLAVEFDKISEDQFKNIWLCGPATFVFKGEIDVTV